MPDRLEHAGAIIVIGSHRSGTSMAAGILRTLGVHMGADCGGELEESAFFRAINVRILRSAGASWYQPAPLRKALGNVSERDGLVDQLRRETNTPTRARYLGVDARQGVPRFAGLDGAWGWKDPRTTLTLPLWRRVFSTPKVIHIVRNGIDVAESLMERERRAPRLRFAALRHALRPIRPVRWGEIKLHPFRGLQDAFDLWAEYVHFGVDATAAMKPDDVLVARYEDVLSAPRSEIRRLAEFVGTDVDPAVMEGLVTRLNVGRRFAFLTRRDLRRFYDRCADHPLMARFEYDRLADLTPP